MKKKKIIIGIISIVVFILITTVLQRSRLITLDCIDDMCPLGGTCSGLGGKRKCLMGYEDRTICDYCDTKNCVVGESFPLSIICKEPQNDSLRVIILLDIKPNYDNHISDEEVKRQKLIIKQTQQKIKDDLGKLIEVYTEYEFTPAMAVKINKSDLETLRKHPQVKSVQIDEVMPVLEMID